LFCFPCRWHLIRFSILSLLVHFVKWQQSLLVDAA